MVWGLSPYHDAMELTFSEMRQRCPKDHPRLMVAIDNAEALSARIADGDDQAWVATRLANLERAIETCLYGSAFCHYIPLSSSPVGEEGGKERGMNTVEVNRA